MKIVPPLRKLFFISVCCTAYFFLFAAISFADLTLVSADEDTLQILLETKYLDHNPVILFPQHTRLANEKIDGLQETSGHVNFVLLDSSYADLAIEFSVVYSAQIPKNKTAVKISIEETADYELYLKSMDGNLRLSASIDSYENQKLDEEETDSKYKKIWMGKLKKGMHRIFVANLSSDLVNKKSTAIDMLLLINKQRRVLFEKVFLEKIIQPFSEVCFIFKNTRERTFEVP